MYTREVIILNKNILATGIIFLFIFSALTPIVFGYNVRTSNEKEIHTTASRDNGLMDSAWPMFQHDIRHTGRSSYGKSGNWRMEKWKFKMDGSVYSSPIINENGTIFIGGWFYFYAINADGSLKWKYGKISGWVESAAAIDENGIIYFGTAIGEYNYFYSLSPNGTLKWKYPIGHHVKSSPAIGNDGTIYFGSDNENIYALYPNGTLRWKFKTGGRVHTSPAIGEDDTIYCGSHDKHMYALYANGTLKWKYNAGCRIGGDPTIDDNEIIYFGGVEEGALYALYPNGTRKWKLTLGSNVVSSPAIAEDGTILVAAYKGSWGAYIYSISPDKTINWRYEVGDEAVSASPAIDKYGVIYMGGWGDNERGNIYALNPDGILRWDFRTGDSIHSDIAIGEDGTIYVGSWDEYLYAIEPIDDDPPEIPDLDGPTNGGINTEYIYTALTNDPDGDNVSYFFDWGDGTSSGWTEFVPSGSSVNRDHSWKRSGTYAVKVKARDKYDRESDWETLIVTMPRNRSTYNSLFFTLLERFPILQKILNFIL